MEGMKYAILAFGMLSTLLLAQCAEQAVFDSGVSDDEDLQEIIYDELEVDQQPLTTGSGSASEAGTEDIAGSETAEPTSPPATLDGTVEAEYIEPGLSLTAPGGSLSSMTGSSTVSSFSEPPKQELNTEPFEDGASSDVIEVQAQPNTHVNWGSVRDNMRDQDTQNYDINDDIEIIPLDPEDGPFEDDSDLYWTTNPTPIPYEQFERPSP